LLPLVRDFGGVMSWSDGPLKIFTHFCFLATVGATDPEAMLDEMVRVTRPGGRLAVCEFSHPVLAPLRAIYLRYLMGALPAVARRVSSNPDAYVYLAESIRVWPDQAGLAGQIGRSGWQRVGWRNLTGGIVALHSGWRL